MKLAIVVPIYNEEENLPEIQRRVVEVCERLPDTAWRVLYVNDGSTDRSEEIILRQHDQDQRFDLVTLSRNFGNPAALAAGLAAVEDADAVIIMDGDLQDPPELIPELVAQWRAGGEVVRAQRRSRQEHGIRKLGFEMFYKVLNWLSDFPIPPNAGLFGLLDREALKELNRFSERNRFFPGLRSWIGFEQRTVLYDRQARASGEPKQTLQRLIRYAFDAIFGFSYKPLRLMTGAGVCISTMGFCFAAFFVFRRLLGIETAEVGFTTLVTLILFLGGVQLIAIGLLGEYLGRVYDEVKRRPFYIVRPRRRGDRPHGS